MLQETGKKGFWKNTPQDVKYLILILVGFMFLIFDQHIVCSWLNGIYPAYSESSGINTEFQLYTLNYLFGLSYNVYEYSIGELAYNIRIDVFSDFIGYILITMGLLKMAKKTKIFNVAAMTSIGAIILYVATRLLPFMFNGAQLCYMCFWLIIAQMGLDICIGYMFVYGVCDLLSGYQYVRDRRAIGISWFASVVLNITVMLVMWMAPMMNGALLTFYNIFDLAVNLLFFWFVFRVRDYILGYKQS